MKNSEWIVVTILSILAVSIVVISLSMHRPSERNFFSWNILPERPSWDLLFPYFFVAKTVLSFVNIILLTIVFVTYLGIYQTTKSQFSLGLIIFSIALLLYALTSNPWIHGVVGFRLSGLGPFTMLPDLSTCIASAILLYLSRQ